jgi:SAM-dependent methyltransferase
MITLNRALQRREEWVEAKSRIVALGLTPHPDDPKNWDHALAFDSLVAHVDRTLPVLDAGGDGEPFSTWLSFGGYGSVDVLNPLFARDHQPRAGVKFIRGDCTRTPYRDRHFGAITCLSVVEHGVDVAAFFKESCRILRPGGRLLVSTDYWPDKIATDHLYDSLYDSPVKVFDQAEMQRVYEIARSAGFSPSSSPHYEVADRVVHWKRMRLSFTFFIMEFIR